MKWGCYTDLHPDILATIRVHSPVVYLPWGALEWHGPHLPFGTNGTIAQVVSERVAQRVGGVLLPLTWWSITPIPHTDSLAIGSSTIRALWDDIFVRLMHANWKVVVVISGHYAPAHELILMEAAEEALNKHGLLVLAMAPFSLVDATMIDHAALWETSLMMAVNPDSVNVSALGDQPLTPGGSAVVGSDPRGTASASMGRRALTIAVDRISKAVEELLRSDDSSPLYALYESRREVLRSYIERYGSTSFEDANRAWWNDVCNRISTDQQEPLYP